MASLRNSARLFRSLQSAQKVASRGLHAKQAGTGYAAARPLLLGAVTAVGAYTAYTTYRNSDGVIVPQATVHAKDLPSAQPSVFSGGKNHALYLWIHLKPNADIRACARAAANLQKYVDVVCPPDMRDEDDEILAGVGFGPNFYQQIGGKAERNYNYPHRKGALGELPSSGGDIFIHAKSNDTSKLFELCQAVMAALPKDSVENFEDIYSFVYKNGRDLSGFIDGTENAADEDDRREIAVEKSTGGSYVITQVWEHQMDVINREKDSVTEKWVGRTKPDSTELSRKPISSHVARMTGGNGWQQKKPFQIVRQSMPYGNVHSRCGLFFIGYAAAPDNFEFMLSNMVGAGIDGHSDDVMRLTKCTKGTYFYFPGAEQLKRLA